MSIQKKAALWTLALTILGWGYWTLITGVGYDIWGLLILVFTVLCFYLK